MTDIGNDDATAFAGSAGDRLRAAREAQNLSLAEVAARTRIPLRHLEAVESGDYRSLPSATYAVGFAKAYARAVGVDEVAIGREVRERDDKAGGRREYAAYEITDPARLPSRGVAIAGAVAAGLLILIAILWLGGAFQHGGTDAAPTAVAAAPDAPPASAPVRTAAAPTPAGQVRLVAVRETWLRVYDGAGKTLFIGTLAPGQAFDVPTGADRPMVNVGRPDQLAVSIDGRPVAALGDGSRPLKDIGVSAAALAARTGPPLPPVTAPAGAAAAPDAGSLNIASPAQP